MTQKHIYLSYFMNSETPLYGGDKGVSIMPDRSISKGDTANTKTLKFGNHSGTHIDYPNHFFDSGTTSEKFNASFWFYERPFVIFLNEVQNDQLINVSDLHLDNVPSNTDFLIISSGFWKYRNEEKYWKNNPGISPDVADELRIRFPNLRTVGMDLISITSFQNRIIGREAHRAFLGTNRPILLVEDMDLSLLKTQPTSLVCLPLMVEALDGSPVSVIAIL